MTPLQLAKLIDQAITIRENSWVIFKDKPLEGGIYTKTIIQCVDEAFNYIAFKELDRNFILPVTVMIEGDKDVAINWAFNIIKKGE